MNSLSRTAIAAAALLAVTAGAHAGVFTLSGNMTYHNDVVELDFSLANAASNVSIWTDSWMSGLNFDPTAALWVKSGSDYTLVQAVDDDDTVAPGQGYYDAGFLLSSLAAGEYKLTLAAAINAANGLLLSEGFAYDSETPIPIAQWNQPSYDPNANDQKGTFWRVTFSGVDAVGAVPEPSTWMLGALGLAALVAGRSRRRSEADVALA